MRRQLNHIDIYIRKFQSTHPLRDATYIYTGCRKSELIFQSTHPLRDATQPMCHLRILLQFQSTHPLRDATKIHISGSGHNRISIHAPLTGCDSSSITNCLMSSYFNPRTPYGMRQVIDTKDYSLSRFQSTHPLRDATMSKALECLTCEHFNPRTPYGMRLNAMPPFTMHTSISIHAPLTGCDYFLVVVSV